MNIRKEANRKDSVPRAEKVVISRVDYAKLVTQVTAGLLSSGKYTHHTLLNDVRIDRGVILDSLRIVNVILNKSGVDRDGEVD